MNRTLKNYAAKGSEITVDSGRVYRSLYRPFTSPSVYFEQELNDMTYQLPSMFPTPALQNIGFVAVGSGESVDSAVLATNLLPDLHLIATSQFFLRFTWATMETYNGALFGEDDVVKRGETSVYGEIGEIVDGDVCAGNIMSEMKTVYRDALGADITGDDIFHIVYGKLHDPAYRAK